MKYIFRDICLQKNNLYPPSPPPVIFNPCVHNHFFQVIEQHFNLSVFSNPFLIWCKKLTKTDYFNTLSKTLFISYFNVEMGVGILLFCWFVYIYNLFFISVPYRSIGIPIRVRGSYVRGDSDPWNHSLHMFRFSNFLDQTIK